VIPTKISRELISMPCAHIRTRSFLRMRIVCKRGQSSEINTPAHHRYLIRDSSKGLQRSLTIHALQTDNDNIFPQMRTVHIRGQWSESNSPTHYSYSICNSNNDPQQSADSYGWRSDNGKISSAHTRSAHARSEIWHEWSRPSQVFDLFLKNDLHWSADIFALQSNKDKILLPMRTVHNRWQ